MKKRKILKHALAAVLAALFCLCGVPAGSASVLPSLFHNDEVWYKDSYSPLIVREGRIYVPAEFFGMFQGIRVTTHAGDNLLIENVATGGYVSILYGDGTSAVNGEIGTDVGVFRDESVYYVEAEPVAGALGLGTETRAGENGAMTLRVTDGSERLSMNQIAASYEPKDESGEGGFWNDVPLEDAVPSKKL